MYIANLSSCTSHRIISYLFKYPIICAIFLEIYLSRPFSLKDGIVSSDGGIVQYGTGVHKLFKNISIICTYDKIQRFATLDIPRCGFHASFRPFDDSIKTGPQSMIPAIVITVDHGTFFGRGGTKSK